MRTRSAFAVLLTCSLVLAACSDDEPAPIEFAEIRSGEVVQTVAAPARLQPRAQAQVTAPVGGEIAELLVEDGDDVERGDVVLRLGSESVDEQVDQARSAVEAAESLAADSIGAGFDLAPVIGGFRGQLDAVVPGILDGLRASTATAESSLQGAIEAVTTSSRAADAWSRALEEALTEAGDTIDEIQQVSRSLEDAIDEEAFERAVAEVDTPDTGVLPELRLPELPDVPEAPELPDLPEPPDTSGVIASLVEAQQGVQETRAALRRTEIGFAEASKQLGDTEAELSRQAEATASVQAQAVDAQVAQARLALEVAEGRSEALTVTAPISGVVEISRGGDTGGNPAELLEGLGPAGGGFTGGGLDSLFGGGVPGGAAPVQSDGIVAEGAMVGVGQPLLTIHDTAAFVAMADVDEIDVVEVVEGQDVEVLVDAFGSEPLSGVVEHVAFSPRSDAVGGALYGVEIRLLDLPDDLRPRAGLTASVEIEVRRVDSDLVVPTSALLRRAGGEVVHVVRDGIIEEIEVSIEAMGDQDAAIDGAVDEGEEVVTIGVELVTDGDELPE